MSRKEKEKNQSTSKYRKFKVSPLIFVIAVIEVLVLVGVSTFAWFSFTSSKTLDSGIIGVEADSGLDIDFQYANKEDYINIWNYIDDDFEFEPVTSLDGRNVFIPTSGTFASQDTGNIIFRDGTINDINTKYLNIDFELTNTSDYDMDIYLNNTSFFKVRNSQDELEESRALRLAFYTNDGNSGNVGSSLIAGSSGSSDGSDSSSTVSEDSCTIYFDSDTISGWSGNIYAYVYDNDSPVVSPEYLSAWPGLQMTRVSGKIYSVTFSNPSEGTNLLTYDKVIFTDGDGHQTVAKTVKKDYLYQYSGTTGSPYTTNTVYFVKPYDWSTVYCHTWTSAGNTHSYTTWPGDEMQYVGSGIYSYTYNATSGSNSRIDGFLFDNGNQGSGNQTVDISTNPSPNNRIYVASGSGTYSASQATRTGTSTVLHFNAESQSDTAAMKYNKVYFFNSFGWEKPYATVTIGSGSQMNTCDIPMVSLSGNVYYCSIPEVYTHVYFRDKNQGNNVRLRTTQDDIVDGTVYRPKDDEFDGGGSYLMSTFEYDTHIQESGYPVISPGVSVGFQRPYSPVVTINPTSGKATEVIPAFSNSIDDYIYSDTGKPVFSIKSGHMLSLSMVLWLEGTDSATDDDTYPAHNIQLRLEFATVTHKTQPVTEDVAYNTGESGYYTYNFYDKTRELWTSDRQSTESGVTVAPVMQLYDNTIKRGYLMEPSDYGSYDGKRKVSCWSVKAPQSIATCGHDIIFRRVNPYDEDEVWNYWYAGPVAGSGSVSSNLPIYDIAKTGSGDDLTISFTAFADGSPLSSMPGVGSGADVPAKSCGGLWGNHAVRTVTLYDAEANQPLKHNGSDGIITVNYSYTYTANNANVRPVMIEYKASGPNYGSFYYIIMPNAAYTANGQTGVTCTFKNYINFDPGYAINSDRNSNITFQKSYPGGKVSGDYFALYTDNAGQNASYWGSDMLYVQTNSETQSAVYSGSTGTYGPRLFQVKFTDGTNNKWCYFRYNSNLNPSSGTGFACVIPNDKAYTSFKLQRNNYDTPDTLYNETSSISLGSTNVTIADPRSSSNNRTVRVVHANNHGYCVTHFESKITLQTTQTSMGTNTYIHAWGDSGNLNNASWPGNYMYQQGTAGSNPTLYQFHYDNLNVLKYNKIIFAYWVDGNNNAGGQSNQQTLSIDNIYTQMIFESKNGNNINWTGNNGNQETMKTSTWTIGSWPHTTIQTS
ncbi:MAG: starch-binding protein [Ruminococcus sp.]|nr:starch-binding protein [Ruminococcus sp.]